MSSYQILDGFLSDDEARQVWWAFGTIRFSGVNARNWEKVFRFAGGGAVVGSEWQVDSPALSVDEDQEFPGPAPFQLFCARLTALMSGSQSPWNGARWTSYTVAPYIYPPGSGLGWHTDRGRLGAFIYYVHPKWRPAWGGELLLASEATAAQSAPGPQMQAHQTSEFEAFFDPDGVLGSLSTGVGSYVMPLPNRLVLIRGGTPHCVKAVEQAAGDAFRASLSGFFIEDET